MIAAPRIVLLCLMIAASTFSIGAFPAVLPEIALAAGLADWELGIVAGAFGFARMVADIPVGLFITRRLRPALALGPALLAAGILTLSGGGPLALLVVGRALMGFGHTFGMLGGLTAILRYTQPGRLSSALNAYEFSAMLGMLGGVLLVSSLPADLGWNAAYAATAAPLTVGIVALPLLLRSLVAADATALPPTRTPAAAASGARSFVVLACIAGAAIAGSYATVDQFMLPLRGSRELGLDRGGVARLLVILQIADIAALLPVGVLSDRHGARRVLRLVLATLALGTILVGFGNLPVMTLGCAVFGLGMAGWMLPLSVLRAETTTERLAWRTALYRLSVDAGLFFGPTISGLLGTSRLAVLAAVLAVVMAVVAAALGPSVRSPVRSPSLP